MLITYLIILLWAEKGEGEKYIVISYYFKLYQDDVHCLLQMMIHIIATNGNVNVRLVQASFWISLIRTEDFPGSYKVIGVQYSPMQQWPSGGGFEKSIPMSWELTPVMLSAGFTSSPRCTWVQATWSMRSCIKDSHQFLDWVWWKTLYIQSHPTWSIWNQMSQVKGYLFLREQ